MKSTNFGNSVQYSSDFTSCFGQKARNYAIDFDFQKTDNVFDFVATLHFDKCYRISTKWMPLKIEMVLEIDRKIIKHRKYGKKVGSQDLNLCNLCFRYIASQITTWETAWPSVFFSLCIQKPSAGYQKLFLKLPLQIQASWFFERLKIKLRKSIKPLFDDITRDKIQFTCLLETHLSEDYKLCMSRYPFPSVKCFCGASEFIEEAGFVGFHHLLNFIDNSFVSFGANWEKFRRCIRADYLDQLPEYIAFRCAPTIEITETGLSLSTCNSDKKGSALIMCHAPRHPSVGNISHTYSDRLAPLVTTVRGAIPAKIGEFSYTYFMSQSEGGRNGFQWI